MFKMRRKFIFTALAILAVCAIIVLAWFSPLQRTVGVAIASSVEILQGQSENDSEMESIKVHGTFWNYGDVIAENLTATVIFSDAANNKVVKKNIPVGGDLLPNKGLVMEFDSEYSRKKTIPKTEVNITIQFDWMENGQYRTTKTFLSSTGSDSLDKGNNNTGEFIYGSAIVESIEILILESFPVQVKVNARGYLPDGCTRIHEITEEREENTFIFGIKTVRPADMFCTMAIVPFQEIISLDVYGLKAGIYTVDVNGKKGTFELSTDNKIQD